MIVERRSLETSMSETFQENISEYVAQLQLHMALQAKNLLPTFHHANSSRHQLLHNTQATIEKLVSRQSC